MLQSTSIEIVPEGLHPPYQGNGIRIAEVIDNKEIIWTRLIKNLKRVGADAPMPALKYIDPIDNKSLTASIHYSVNGKILNEEIYLAE